MPKCDFSKVVLQLKFPYRKSRYLTPMFGGLLCNALMQPHFDYGCSSWFPLLKKKLKIKLQKVKNLKTNILAFA